MGTAKVRSEQAGGNATRNAAVAPKARPRHAAMAAALPATLCTLVALCAFAAPALAEPSSSAPLSEVAKAQLSRHGTVSRHFWAPGFATTEVGGLRLAAGLAVGVRAPLRSAVGAAVVPALVLQTGSASNLTLLRAEQGGALLVWQIRN